MAHDMPYHYSGLFFSFSRIVDYTHDNNAKSSMNSGRSRISRRGACGPVRGEVDPQCGHFSAKMYAKMKELGPVGWRAPYIRQ